MYILFYAVPIQCRAHQRGLYLAATLNPTEERLWISSSAHLFSVVIVVSLFRLTLNVQGVRIEEPYYPPPWSIAGYKQETKMRLSVQKMYSIPAHLIFSCQNLHWGGTGIGLRRRWLDEWWQIRRRRPAGWYNQWIDLELCRQSGHIYQSNCWGRSGQNPGKGHSRFGRDMWKWGWSWQGSIDSRGIHLQ